MLLACTFHFHYLTVVFAWVLGQPVRFKEFSLYWLAFPTAWPHSVLFGLTVGLLFGLTVVFAWVLGQTVYLVAIPPCTVWPPCTVCLYTRVASSIGTPHVSCFHAFIVQEAGHTFRLSSTPI